MSSLSAISGGVVSSSGVVLALPHAAGMQSSLPLLQKNNKFSKVFYWGKLMGLTGDYLIAMGIEDSYSAKKFFFCMDGVSWAQLPAPTEEMTADCSGISGPMSGDISKVYELPVPEPAEGEEPAEPKTVTEIDRLAVMVATIDSECAMLPAGALMKKADGSVVDSPTFAGLEYAKATSAKSFVFVNQPKAVSANADAITAATDFLTTCDQLIPTGALVSKFDEATNVVTWRSLLYPGFLAYCAVGSATAGYVYSGNGEKNADIAFMLP